MFDFPISDLKYTSFISLFNVWKHMLYVHASAPGGRTLSWKNLWMKRSINPDLICGKLWKVKTFGEGVRVQGWLLLLSLLWVPAHGWFYQRIGDEPWNWSIKLLCFFYVGRRMSESQGVAGGCPEQDVSKGGCPSEWVTRRFATQDGLQWRLYPPQ